MLCEPDSSEVSQLISNCTIKTTEQPWAKVLDSGAVSGNYSWGELKSV